MLPLTEKLSCCQINQLLLANFLELKNYKAQWGAFYLLIAKFFATKNIEVALKSLWSFCD
jgi:hypothetical protein